jgi:hypothetical protein
MRQLQTTSQQFHLWLAQAATRRKDPGTSQIRLLGPHLLRW